jgi:uncharacterized protein YbaR (Trm112 family)
MALESFLLDLLEDPKDHGVLLYIADENVLYNPRLRIVYEVRDSIPVLLPDEAKPVSDAQHDAYVQNPKARATGKS